jgi:hypothetical protein
MNIHKLSDEQKKYINSNGLDVLIDFRMNSSSEPGFKGNVSDDPFAPEVDDLLRLHKLIRSRKPFTVLEFGTGYSTVMIADALKKNQTEWDALPNKPKIRNRFMFQLFSVDASKRWLDKTKETFPKHLVDLVHFWHSEVEIGTFNGQLCHYYKNIPDVVPEFIYLDGPDPQDVKGNINGLSFGCEERTVMSGDLLLMESTFLPGMFILIDGRTNNARFLERNFSRKYKMKWNRKGDTTTFELVEDRLGRNNILGSDLY